MWLRWLSPVRAAMLPRRLLSKALSAYLPSGDVRPLRQLLPQAVSPRLPAANRRLLRRLLPKALPVRDKAVPVPSLLPMLTSEADLSARISRDCPAFFR